MTGLVSIVQPVHNNTKFEQNIVYQKKTYFTLNVINISAQFRTREPVET